jgi:hypothetical protein
MGNKAGEELTRYNCCVHGLAQHQKKQRDDIKESEFGALQATTATVHVLAAAVFIIKCGDVDNYITPPPPPRAYIAYRARHKHSHSCVGTH